MDVAALHGCDQALVGLVAARDDEQPGGVLVEAVDDAGARLVAAAGAFGDEPLRQRAVLVPGAGCTTTPAGLSTTSSQSSS